METSSGILHYEKKPPGRNSHSSLYLFESFALFLSKKIPADVHTHSHHLLKIFISLNHSFSIEYKREWRLVETAIIRPDVAHRFASDEGAYAVLYVEGESEAGQRLYREYLGSQMICALPASVLMPVRPSLIDLLEGKGSISNAQSASIAILSLLLENYAKSTSGSDPRIRRIITILKQSPDKKANIEAVARQVGLSESRLIHLFTYQVGVPPRRYALWLRLLDAIDEIVNGASFTDAAYAAGFSDSAHLSRTFRKMFGLSLVEVFKSTSVASSFKRF